MSKYEIISVVSAIGALLVSAIAVFFNAVQTKKLTESNLMQQQLARGNAVIHFTGRFFDLIAVGEPLKKFSDPDWAYQFWSLQATEFYFFHHGILPTFMYTLWMIELAKMYAGPYGKEIRGSHVNFLNCYSSNYPHMIDFYNQLCEIAKANEDENLRNRKVSEFVTNWCVEYRRSLLD